MDGVSFGGATIFSATLPFSVAVFFKFLFSPLSHPFWAFLQSVNHNYFKEQRNGAPVANVKTPLDAKIPIENSVRTYLSFFPFALGIIFFLHKNFRGADAEIKESFARGRIMYEKAGGIFRKIQSTLERPALPGMNFWILHRIDKNRDCYPSMHVQIVGEVYLLFKKVIAVSSNPHKYGELDKAIFNHGVKILEACCTTKQHSLQDIAAGFAALSFLNEDCKEEIVFDFVDSMFKNHSRPKEEDKIAIRSFINNSYRGLLRDLQKRGYPEAFLDRLAAMHPAARAGMRR